MASAVEETKVNADEVTATKENLDDNKEAGENTPKDGKITEEEGPVSASNKENGQEVDNHADVKPEETSDKASAEDNINETEKKDDEKVDDAKIDDDKELPEKSSSEEVPKTSRKKENKKEDITDTPADTGNTNGVTSGKRKRTAPQAFNPATYATPEKKELAWGVGDGATFGEIAYIVEKMERKKADEYAVLHRICYGRPGEKTSRKKNLRKFNGFAFGVESPAYEKKLKQIKKLSKRERSQIVELLGIKKTATINDIMKFLHEPVDSGKHVTPATKSKKPTASRKSSRPVKKISKVDQIYSDVDDEDLSMSESDHDDAHSDDYVPGRSTKRSKSNKSSSPKKKRKKTEKEVKLSESEEEEEEIDAGDEDEDDGKGSDEFDGELEKVIKEVVGSINLEEMSMNDAISKVYERYPDKDISDKKDFIKDRIREMI